MGAPGGLVLWVRGGTPLRRDILRFLANVAPEERCYGIAVAAPRGPISGPDMAREVLQRLRMPGGPVDGQRRRRQYFRHARGELFTINKGGAHRGRYLSRDAVVRSRPMVLIVGRGRGGMGRCLCGRFSGATAVIGRWPWWILWWGCVFWQSPHRDDTPRVDYSVFLP